jgi:hypothetical protein
VKSSRIPEKIEFRILLAPVFKETGLLAWRRGREGESAALVSAILHTLSTHLVRGEAEMRTFGPRSGCWNVSRTYEQGSAVTATRESVIPATIVRPDYFGVLPLIHPNSGVKLTSDVPSQHQTSGPE